MDVLNIPLPEDIMKLKWNGEYDLAIKMIDLRIQKDIPNQLKERLLLEKELIKNISNEFIYTKEEAISILKERIKDFKEEEFEQLFLDGAFEFLYVHSKMMFKNDFYDNLVKTRKEYRKRSQDTTNNQNAQFLEELITKIEKQGDLSYRIHVKTSLKMKDESAKIGKTIKVYLPIPIQYAQVEEVHILKTTPKATLINDNDTPQRCVYFEVTLEKGQVFSVEYELVTHTIYQKLDPTLVYNEHPDCCLEEKQPHIVFTPYLKTLAKEIVKDETNPLVKAKLIYEYITSHVMYSFVRLYSTLPCISEYAATSLKGDCGVQALLFITLCRIVGIPATWQAGLYATPYTIGNHDWARFYVAPYGWLYADCSFGGSAYRQGSTLRRDFYFGHLEPCRIPCASEFQADFIPPMHSLRRDPFDNQTGEVEYSDESINLNDYEMDQEVISIEEI